MLPAEGVDLPGKHLGDMGISQVFADYGGVLRFRQGVVVGVPGARRGQIDPEFLRRRDTVWSSRSLIRWKHCPNSMRSFARSGGRFVRGISESKTRFKELWVLPPLNL